MNSRVSTAVKNQVKGIETSENRCGSRKMIPPDAQRAMCKRAGSMLVELKGSHAVYVSQPQAVASFIEQAAKGVASPR